MTSGDRRKAQCDNRKWAGQKEELFNGQLSGKFLASLKVEVEGTLETSSLAILQVRKLRPGEGGARLIRHVSFIPTLTHLSLCVSSAGL